MPVIGYLDPRSPDAISERLQAFREGLKETGYVVGENVAIEAELLGEADEVVDVRALDRRLFEHAVRRTIAARDALVLIDLANGPAGYDGILGENRSRAQSRPVRLIDRFRNVFRIMSHAA